MKILIFFLVLLTACSPRNNHIFLKNESSKQVEWKIISKNINCSKTNDVYIEINNWQNLKIDPSLCNIITDRWKTYKMNLDLFGRIEKGEFVLDQCSYKIINTLDDSIVEASKIDFKNKSFFVIDSIKYKNSVYYKLITTKFKIVEKGLKNEDSIFKKYFFKFEIYN